MPTAAELLTPPLVALALAFVIGLGLATLRAPRSGPGWLTLDALLVLPLFLPASLLANLALLLPALGAERLTAWILATTLAALPFTYLPLRLALARTVATYRDTAALLGYNCPTRLWRIDLPLLWPLLPLSALLAAARIAAEWFLVIGNLQRFTPFTAALAVLALAAALTLGVALTRLTPRV